MEVTRWRSGDDPVVSVVLPTIPSRDHKPVLSRLRRQAFNRSWEVLVVVDDEPTDRRCEARNLGLEEASAEIVAHTDDDVEPPKEWVANLYNAFDPDVICVEGRVVGGLRYDGEGIYVGCNLAVRRDAALSVGGWDEAYAGWRDDTEFGWRLERDADGDCVYRHGVAMRHPPTPKTNYRSDQERRLRESYPTRYRERIVGTRKDRLLLALQRNQVGATLVDLYNRVVLN